MFIGVRIHNTDLLLYRAQHNSELRTALEAICQPRSLKDTLEDIAASNFEMVSGSALSVLTRKLDQCDVSIHNDVVGVTTDAADDDYYLVGQWLRNRASLEEITTIFSQVEKSLEALQFPITQAVLFQI